MRRSRVFLVACVAFGAGLVVLSAGGASARHAPTEVSEPPLELPAPRGPGMVHRLGPQVAPAEGGKDVDGGGVAAQAIIGNDERVRITSTTTFPASAIAYLDILVDGDLFSCTATFIGSQVLLTAAHCLWDRDSHQWASIVRVVPGKNGPAEPFGGQFADSLWVPDGWIETGGAPGYDWGLIHLPTTALSANAGWMRVGLLSKATLSSSDFQPAILGYPGDKPEGTLWGSIKNAFLDVSDFFLFHDIDAYQGQSGSAVFSLNSSAFYLAYVVGIHSAGVPGQWNRAIRIDAFVLADLLEGCRQMDCTVDYRVEAAGPVTTPTPTPTRTATPSPTLTRTPASTPTLTSTTTRQPSPSPTQGKPPRVVVPLVATDR